MLGNERASAGNDGVGSGCTTLWGCSTAIECDATGRKSPQQDRSHKPRREANGGAQCGKSARCVVRPAKAGVFSRSQSCRGRSQSPVVWIAEVMGNRNSEAYRQDLPRGGYESPGRNKSERVVASKVSIPEGRASHARAKATWTIRTLTDTAGHLGGVEATAR